MSQFLLCEAIDENGNHVDDEGDILEIEESETVSDNEFIDDTEFDESVEEHYAFTNVTRNYTEAVEDSFSDFGFDQEPNNYCNENEVHDLPIDDFKDYKKKIDSFTETLINPQGLNNKDSFYYSILFTIRYQLTDKIQPCANDDKLKEDIRAEIFECSMKFIRLKV